MWKSCRTTASPKICPSRLYSSIYIYSLYATNTIGYKDLLKVGGENVDPIEVEGFLLRHPAIDQVQIIGVPDPRLSEVPCACILPTPGEDVTHDALVAFCRGQLASFKITQYTVILESFPMTSSGKVQKFKLREMVTASLGLGQPPPARST